MSGEFERGGLYASAKQLLASPQHDGKDEQVDFIDEVAFKQRLDQLAAALGE